MLRMTFGLDKIPNPKILCLGAHSDDLEIGCAGTIRRLIKIYPGIHITWIVLSSTPPRKFEAIESATALLSNLSEKEIIIRDFKDSFFPYIGQEIKEYFEQLKQKISPDLIFTHYRQDLHQDHRLISELTWNAFRDHMILEYEIPKYDGDLGAPNFFVHLNEADCQSKIKHIMTHFKTQLERDWFTDDTFLSVLRLRGMESNSPGKFAEAFYCRKIVGL